MPGQAKHWCFTLNNYTADEYDALSAIGHELPKEISYIIVAKETGETGTPHLQGYISFDRKRSFIFPIHNFAPRLV